MGALLGVTSSVRCERERVYAALLGRARGHLAYARMRAARADVFGAPCCVCTHWSAECRRWERVCRYVARRARLARAFGV